MKKVFISHASKDEAIVKSLMDDILVGSLAVKVSEIFCTTTDGTKIESGEDWRNSIQEALQNAEITLLIITPNYKESEVCICEMGAAWVSSSKVIPLIVDPINYLSVGIIQEPKQWEKLNDDRSLDRLRDLIQEKLKINPAEIRSDRWTTKKIEFLQKVKVHLTTHPFAPPLSRNEFENVMKEKNDLTRAVGFLKAEKTKLEVMNNELKKLKDAEAIKEIEKKYGKVGLMDEFSELCEKVSSILSNLSPILRGIIFVSYSKKNVVINYDGREDQVHDAISRDFITDSIEADWKTTPLMFQLHQSLDDLSRFLIRKEDKDEHFMTAYYEEFAAPLSLTNIDFWKEAFELDISIS